MKQLARPFIPLILLILCATHSARAAERFDDSAVKHIAYPAWFVDSPFHDLQEDLRAALADGKHGLMILFTTEGCSYCEAFIRKSLGDPGIAGAVQQGFAAVGLEIFDDTELTDPRGATLSTKAFAAREGAAFAPTLLFYGKDGETLLRVVGYQSPERFRAILAYVRGGHYRNEPLRTYLARLASHTPKPASAAVLRQDPLFAAPPHQLDRSRLPAEKPLLVIFETAGCDDCTVFHDEVLAADDIRALLARFDVVRLDAADSNTPVVAPDGGRTTPAAWFERAEFTRTPALQFFDERNAEVLKTDTLVLRQRMRNSLLYVLEHAYAQGMTYQRFARSKSLERMQRQE